MLFSATMPPEIAALSTPPLSLPTRPRWRWTSCHSPVEVIRQSVYYVDQCNKDQAAPLPSSESLEGKNALVFTRTKHGANKVAGDLVKAGIPPPPSTATRARPPGSRPWPTSKRRGAGPGGYRHRCPGTDIEDSPTGLTTADAQRETYVHRIPATASTAISAASAGRTGSRPSRSSSARHHGGGLAHAPPPPPPDKRASRGNLEDAEAQAAARAPPPARMRPTEAAAEAESQANQYWSQPSPWSQLQGASPMPQAEASATWKAAQPVEQVADFHKPPRPLARDSVS